MISTNDKQANRDALSPWYPRVVFLVLAFVILETLGGPSALLSHRLPYGHDFSGHDWWLTAFRTAVLHGHPLGWSSQIDNGYLFGYTYFPFPPLVVTVLAVVLPVAIAIKSMVWLAILSMPFGLWQLIKGLGYDRFAQCLVIVLSPMVLWSNHLTTIGGTEYDVLVGEFSMGLSLGLGLCALGEIAKVRRGEGRWWVAACWLGCSVLSHVQGALAIAIGVVVFTAYQWRESQRVLRVLAAGGLAAGLSAWWWLPGLSVSSETLGDVNPVSHSVPEFLWTMAASPLLLIGVVGLGLGWWRGRPGARELLTVVVLLTPTVLLPFKVFTAGRVYPIVFLLAVCGVVFVVLEALDAIGRSPTTAKGVTVVLLAGAVGGGMVPLANGLNRSTLLTRDHQTFNGIESFKGYPAIRHLASVLESLPPGRAEVETPLNFQSQTGDWLWQNLLPLWTHGHVAAPLSLFINTTPTTVGLEYAYENITPVYAPVISWQPHPQHPSVAAGVAQLRALGVTYIVAETPGLKGSLDATPGVTLVATSVSPSVSSVSESLSPYDTQDTFWVYEVRGSQTVSGLTHLTPMTPLAIKPYALSMTKYLNEVGVRSSTATPVVGLSHAYDGPVATVSDVSITDQRIHFHVATTNEPVIIRESYSPLWHVTGGRLYQAEPNEMLVWPTSTSVTMTFTPPVTQTIGLGVTTLSVVGLAYLVVTDLRRRRAGDQD